MSKHVSGGGFRVNSPISFLRAKLLANCMSSEMIKTVYLLYYEMDKPCV